MAITYSFADNVSYGTEDVNNITARLVGAGIAPFAAKNSYSPSDLNALTAAVTSSGVSPNCCRCTKSGTAVSVAQGIIYFENGVTMEVDSEGFTVTVPQNTAGYVYAYYNDSLQTADIVFTAELPQTGYYVLLAEISAAGALTDRRTPARSKVATFGTKDAFLFSMSLDNTTNTTESMSDGKYVPKFSTGAVTTLNVDASKFNYIISLSKSMPAVYSFSENEWLFFLPKRSKTYEYDVWGEGPEINTAVPGEITITPTDTLWRVPMAVV